MQADYLSLDDAGLMELFDEVRRKPPSLIILDPLFAYCRARRVWTVPMSSDRFCPRDIAENGDTAVLIIRHLTKTTRDKAIYQGAGSMDVIGGIE